MAGTRRSLQELSAEVATNPNSTAFVELAAAYRERGDFERAARLCLRGLERHPTHVEAHYELGRIYEARGERELALDEWMIVRQLAPDHLPALCASVRLFLEEGRLEAAERELNQARTLAPNNPAVRSLLKQFEVEKASAKTGGSRPSSASARGPSDNDLGALGVLLVDAHGRLTAGRMKGRTPELDRELGRSLSGARSEAERVASYLKLGEWKGMVVESSSARLSVSPVGDGVIIVATDPTLPAGRAARIVRKARDGAHERLEDETG